mmetsp:Transcript_53300/g.113236  ORF Transcript_53300/g.113236 Transcript_53300/m.113236 type:complete len:244 (-) Transcript_53300:193-924(-)
MLRGGGNAAGNDFRCPSCPSLRGESPPGRGTVRYSDPPRGAPRPSAPSFAPAPSVPFLRQAPRRPHGGCVSIRAPPTRHAPPESSPGSPRWDQYRRAQTGTHPRPRQYQIRPPRHCSPRPPFRRPTRPLRRGLAIESPSFPLLGHVSVRPLPFFVAAFRFRPPSLVWTLAQTAVSRQTLGGRRFDWIRRRMILRTRTSCRWTRSCRWRTTNYRTWSDDQGHPGKFFAARLLPDLAEICSVSLS